VVPERRTSRVSSQHCQHRQVIRRLLPLPAVLSQDVK
jgi:hypothetical protein